MYGQHQGEDAINARKHRMQESIPCMFDDRHKQGSTNESAEGGEQLVLLHGNACVAFTIDENMSSKEWPRRKVKYYI